MRWQQLLSRFISEFISLGGGQLKPKKGLRILTYHSIGSKAHGDVGGLNSISKNQFLEHIQILRQYNIISIGDAMKSPIEPAVSLTFDDGYADNLYVAAPILCELNIPFTVFVASNLVDRCESGFLSPSELVELSNFPGVTIGSHGASHKDLTNVDQCALQLELEGSKKYIEDLTGYAVDSISYPYGRYDQRVIDSTFEAGYKYAASSTFGVNKALTSNQPLKRCAILSTDSARSLFLKLEGAWDWYQYANRIRGHD